MKIHVFHIMIQPPETFFHLITLAMLLMLSGAHAQRLSQGASDWYMRFRSFTFAKRNMDLPVTRSFYVTSVVKYRYAITRVETIIYNPATIAQNYSFGFVMPKSALVSNVTLYMDTGGQVKSTVDASEWALEVMEVDANNGDQHKAQEASTMDRREKIQHHYQLHHRADFKQFVLPLTLKANSQVDLSLVYEYLLERCDSMYNHVLSLNPGQIVSDFQIKLDITENRPFRRFQVMAPVIGEITQDALKIEKAKESNIMIDMSISAYEQNHYFGNKGFIGEFRAVYDLENGNDEVDIVVEDDFFVHLFRVPHESTMKSIQKHILFLLDTSESMRGAKLEHAKKSMTIMLDFLDESDFVNLLVFNENVTQFMPALLQHSVNTSHSPVSLPCTNHTRQLVSLFLATLGAEDNSMANLTEAIQVAITLSQQVWESGIIPANTLTMIVLLTDGQLENDDDSEDISKRIRYMNNVSKIPIFALGIGLDSNMDFLEDVAEASCGRRCTGNIIEDSEPEPQLNVIKNHLNDVVLKNLNLSYDFDSYSLTKTNFKVFHKGGAVSVAGQFDADNVFSKFNVSITGQSALGTYKHHPPPVPFVTNGCHGQAILCSQRGFIGHCISITDSNTNLKSINFDNLAVSIRIEGDCAWVAYDLPQFQGHNTTFMPPGAYEGLPGKMHKTISSIRIVAPSRLGRKFRYRLPGPPAFTHEGCNMMENSVARQWAFIKIRDVLDKATDGQATKVEIESAYSLAMKYHFLTPFTNLYFVLANSQRRLFSPRDMDHATFVEPRSGIDTDWAPIRHNLMTYGDLSPIFFQMDDPSVAKQWQALKSCMTPIKCIGKFHIEEIHTEDQNCTGSIILYTKPNFEGESYKVMDTSIYQLYHSVNAQKIRSVRTEGNCCWLLFSYRQFAPGEVERVCGETGQSLRAQNLGSIKRIEPPRMTTTHKKTTSNPSILTTDH